MTEDEKKRKKRFDAEYKVKIMDEGKKLVVKKNTEPTRKFEGKGKTPVDVHPILKTSAEKNVKEARLNELSSKTTGAYVTKATDDYVSASKNRDEKRRAKRLTGILRAHRLEKKRDGLSESVKTTNAGYGYHGTLDPKKADAEYAKTHTKIKEILNGKPKTGKDKTKESTPGIPDRVITHYLDSVHGRKLGDSGMSDDHEHIKQDFKKFRQNYNPNHFGEEVEQVDEISHKTLASYIKKADRAADDADMSYGANKRFADKIQMYADTAKNRKAIEDHRTAANASKKLRDKRRTGASLARIKHALAKEEVEQVDELSNKTMKAYVDKARVSSDTGDEQTVLKRNRGVKLALARAKKRFPEKFKEETEMNEFTVEEFLEYLGGLTEDQAELELDMLDELSKKTLGKYLDKAPDSKYDLAMRALKANHKAQNYKSIEDFDPEKAKMYRDYQKILSRKSYKRRDSAYLAYKKLNGQAKVNASEEVEPIDELSRSRLSAYISKAKGQETTAKAPRRLEGIKLALKKKWGDAKYGLPEPRVKATEEVESIDELSKKTLSSYVKYAARDSNVESGQAGSWHRAQKDTKVNQRLRGIGKAVDKMSGQAKVNASEEVTFVDQLTAVAESKGMSVTFNDGTKAAISPGTARRLLDRYETIGEDHQNEFIEKISSNLKTLRESVLR